MKKGCIPPLIQIKSVERNYYIILLLLRYENRGSSQKLISLSICKFAVKRNRMCGGNIVIWNWSAMFSIVGSLRLGPVALNDKSIQSFPYNLYFYFHQPTTNIMHAQAGLRNKEFIIIKLVVRYVPPSGVNCRPNYVIKGNVPSLCTSRFFELQFLQSICKSIRAWPSE